MGVEIASTKRRASRDDPWLVPWCECEDGIAFFFFGRSFFCEGSRRKRTTSKINKGNDDESRGERKSGGTGPEREREVEKKIDRQENEPGMHFFVYS